MKPEWRGVSWVKGSDMWQDLSHHIVVGVDFSTTLRKRPGADD